MLTFKLVFLLLKGIANSEGHKSSVVQDQIFKIAILDILGDLGGVG